MPKWPQWIRCLIVVAVVAAADGLIVRNGFVGWDDPHTIYENYRVTPPTLAGLAASWRAPQGDLYIPVTYTVWWCVSAGCHLFDLGGSGLPAVGFHLASLLIHMLAGLALLSLLSRIVRDSRAALLGTLVFVAHPVQVEAVAWASGLKDLLMGMFLIVALRAYVAAADRRGRAATRWWVVATVAALAAMLSKPTAIVAPLLAVAIDRAATTRSWRQTLAWSLPWLALSIPVAYCASRVQRPIAAGLDQTFAGRWVVAGDALGFYLRKLVLPLPLGVDYGRRPDVIAAQAWRAWTWVAPLMFVVAGMILFGDRRRQRREMAAAGVLFVGPLLPVLGFVSFDFQQYSTVADHYLYLPMAGVALGVAAVVARLRVAVIWDRVDERGWSRWAARAAAVFLIAAMTLLSAAQARTWRDTPALFGQALKANPTSWAAYDNLAAMDVDQGDYAAALKLAEQAARYGPWAGGPQITLGLARAHLGDDAGAAAAFNRAIAIEPGNAVARVNLGMLRAQQGHAAEAADLFIDAIRLDPQDAEAHLNLGALYAQDDRLDDALRELSWAVELAPGNFLTHANLGVVLAEMHRRDDAISQLNEALRLNPNYAAARRTLEAVTTQP